MNQKRTLGKARLAITTAKLDKEEMLTVSPSSFIDYAGHFNKPRRKQYR